MAIASYGGHWIELVRLHPAFSSYDVLWVTTRVLASPPTGTRPVARIVDAARDSWWRLPLAFAQLTALLLRFRPRLVVTTGAAPGLAAVMLGRLVGARTIWIDSIANAEHLSLSGRLARHWTNRALTQWEELATPDSGFMPLGRVF